MQQNSNETLIQALNKIQYMIGDVELLVNMQFIPVKQPFDDEVLDFLNTVSKTLMGLRASRAYPDVITLGFWLRRSSMNKLKERYTNKDEDIHFGRGLAFHIAPSNVPVNYAYSLVAGLLTGNANVLRIPSKDFPQVDIINEAILKALEKHENMRPYICLIRYGRDKEINDALSAMSDTRIIWGGDATIAELRKSPLAPRACEITFADRFSIAVVDSNAYLLHEDKKAIAEAFYNDTYLTDQNACTSPRLVVWLGTMKSEAKQVFWQELHDLAVRKYVFQPIQGINKLTSSYLMAAKQKNVKIEKSEDNLIVRVNVPKVTTDLIEMRDNSGYFFEYDCDNILDLQILCMDKRCQTIGLFGNVDLVKPLLLSGIRGVDRVVPVGKTMDFNLIWDGYNLVERLTRTIKTD